MDPARWFRISVSYGSAVCAVTCAGDLDGRSGARVIEAATLCIERGCVLLVLGCENVTAVDADGLEALSAVVSRCRAEGTGCKMVPGEAVAAGAAALDLERALGIDSRRVVVGDVENRGRRPRHDPIVLRAAQQRAHPRQAATS